MASMSTVVSRSTRPQVGEVIRSERLELGDEVVIETYVQTHGHTLAH
jgi:hypothetical protein